MREPNSDTPLAAASPNSGDPDDNAEGLKSVLTTAADVESAGRSCLVIVVLAVFIIALLLLWIVVRSTAGG